MKFLIVLLLFASSVFADDISFDTTSDNTIEIKTFEGDGKNLIIYLPNHRGLGNVYPKWADKLSFDGFDTWAIDLHSSYMLAKTRSSINTFNIQDLVEIVHLAKQKGFKNLYFITSNDGSILALKTAYQYQKKYQNNFIKGHIFHSPHLIYGSVDIGKQAQYEQIAKYSNLPIYIMLSDSSTKFMRLAEISNTLQTGGSQVYSKVLKGISAGFFMRPTKSLTSKDILEQNKLDTYYKNAIQLLSYSKIAPLKTIANTQHGAKNSKLQTTLIPLNQQAEKLELFNLDKTKISLKDYKNQVVLLNFWASWCKPCIKEIPSLLRLRDKINNKNFKILTVNIGESKEKIIKFRQKLKREQKVDFNLEILFDSNGVGTRDWNIYAYPSNYILDKNGVVKYGFRGALEWDREDIVQTIQELLNE